jgi:hypothetical protein
MFDGSTLSLEETGCSMNAGECVSWWRWNSLDDS